MNEITIRVSELSKRYRLQRNINGSRYRTLREEILEQPRRLLQALRLRKRAESEDFWALKDVSFEVKRGEILGVIGRNGAGKSTLLKILSRVVEPTNGSVDIFGRVGSLLEIGTGFHPELSGRENIFLSGAMLGMKQREIRSSLDKIISFAEVEQFVDQPVKHYSSGMYTRLAFSIATHLSAEIVLMDEVLAVGDAEFKRRCSERVSEMVKNEERTVVIVSHEPALIRNLCSRAILLRRGQIEHMGSPTETLQRYHTDSANGPTLITAQITRRFPGFEIKSVTVANSSVRRVVLEANCEWLDVEVVGTVDFSARVALEVRLQDHEGAVLALCSPGHDQGNTEKISRGPFSLRQRIRLPRLLKGRFGLSIFLTDPNLSGWVDIPNAVDLETEGTTTALGFLPAGGRHGWMLLDSKSISSRPQIP